MARSVLVIDPDEESAGLIDQVLGAAGIACRVVPDAETGWREFCRAPTDVVVTALTTPRRDGAWLVRRLRDEYIGTPPPVYAIAAEGELGPTTRALELDAVLLRPVSAEALTALVIVPAREEATSRQAARLRELFELSLLHGDIDANIKGLLDRIARAFHVADCVLWGPSHEERWPQTKRSHERAEDRALLLWRCDLAIVAGATLVVADGKSAWLRPVVSGLPTRSLLGISLDAPGASAVGALCLVDEFPRRFSSEECDALRALGRRLALELAWRSAHERLAAEHDRLRETALLDPLMGIWTRGALEEGATGEIARARGGNDPLAVAVIDVVQLRHINDRHGHVAGDAVLAHLARIVRGVLRPQDLVGRLGGDEVCIVLPSTPPHDAHALLQELSGIVASHPLTHEGVDIDVRIRIGATSLAPHDETADEAIARAGAALRHARRARVGFHWSDPTVKGSASGPHDAVLPDVEQTDILPTGTTLGGMYQILHEISRGAMGVVYRAEDLGLGRSVAVKVLRADLARDAELVTRFRAEAAMLAALHHENLVGVYTFGAQGDEVYFVMELVEGEALSDLLARADEAGEPLAFDLVSSVVSQVAGALDAMHRAGAVHRDVKPANILLDRARDRAVLVDVGVAKRRGAGGDAAGTPGFAAPESFTAQDEGPATDVYGLAATAYMLLTGLAPFGGGDVAKVVRRQLHERPAEPQALRADLAPTAGKALLRALSPAPRDRYQGALEFAHALGAALSEPPEPLPPGVEPPPRRTHSPGPMPTTTRRLALALSEVQPHQPSSFGNSRGALFRVAYKILGNRLGSGWIRRACERDAALAEVLRPTIAPLGWYPVERLVTLLHAVPAGVRDPHKVSRELGRAAMTASFARFFGADPSSLTPAEVWNAGAVFWSRYHSWGRFSVATGDHSVAITVMGTPGDPLICCLVEGMFERITELAGGDGARARHVACETQGSIACQFEITWGQPAS